MQINKSLSLLLLFSLVAIESMVAPASRLERVKERAKLRRDKALNTLKEKKLDAEDKAIELKDKAGDYLEKKKNQAREWKNRTKKKLKRNYNHALERAKVD
jgi:hypothetical protein